MKVAIIPARGGSKRIKNKNIKSFYGKPIISYSIEAAKKSGLFDKVIVTTDSDEIAKIAEEYGAEIPFKRPDNLSDDNTPTVPVLLNAIEWLEDHGNDIDSVCCIYATAPFVKSENIKTGYKLMKEKKVSSAFSVTSFPFTIFRSLKINKSGQVEMFWPEHELTRSNDLPEAYHDAGQFYWLDNKKFKETKKLYGSDTLPVILPRYLVQDIDTLEDWETAETLFELCKNKGYL